MVAAYDPAAGEPHPVSELALELHVPEGPFSPFDPADWTQRGANLCAWEEGLRTPLAEREIAIDPVVGRIVVAVRSEDQSDAVRDRLRAVFAYGAVGPVGAHPIDRPALPAATATVGPGTSLEDALGDLQSAGARRRRADRRRPGPRASTSRASPARSANSVARRCGSRAR